ncbi:S-adenosyl-L-methionine-dependent methyltransferase, partial [Aureobasidium melanogenum]
MPPPLTQAARIASRIASAARAAEKTATKVNKGELAAAVSQLKKAKKSNKKTAPAKSESPSTPSIPAAADGPSVPDVSETTRYKNLASYRNLFTYYAHQDYPLSNSLSNVFTDRAFGPSHKEKFPDNVDVVSEPLCDHIIDYLGPDLDKHKGCDIIDLHPGACLWSQKIHQRLQPRRHLLLEPDERYLHPFIKPLLDQKDSAYRHTTLSGAAPKGYFDTYDKIFNDHLLPARHPLPVHDPRLREPNNSLLVIGNLVRRYTDIRTGSNAVAFPNLILHHLAEAAQTNIMFQRYGLVRVLLWLPDEIKASILPDSVLHRTGYSINLESAFDIAEVVGSDRSQLSRTDINKKSIHRQRQDQLDVWSARRVLKRMQSKGMAIPEHRRPEMHQKALDTDDESLSDYDPIRLPKDKSLQAAVDVHEKQLNEMAELAAIPRAKRKHLPPPTARFKLTSASQEYIKLFDQPSCRLWFDSWGLQLALEHEYSATKTKMPEEIRADLETRILAADKKLSAIQEKMFSKDVSKQMNVLIDELFALCRPDPMMEWDRRPFEPMTAADEEFWPRFPMRLVDLKPRAEVLGDDLMNATEANHVRRGLLKAMFTHPSSPLLESVDRLGPGARDILGPEFSDPAQGGRMDPKHLLTKDITREQLVALTKAYIEWPFRPLGSEALEASEVEVV